MLKVQQLMRAEIVSIAPGQTLREAVDLLVAEGIGGVPVVDGGKVVGVLSARAIIEFEAVTSPASETAPATRVELEEWTEA